MRVPLVILVLAALSLATLALVHSSTLAQPGLVGPTPTAFGNAYDPASYGLPPTLAGYKTFAVLTSDNTACMRAGEKRLVLQAVQPNVQDFLSTSNAASVQEELTRLGFTGLAHSTIQYIGPGTTVDQFLAENESWNQQRRKYGCVTAGTAATAPAKNGASSMLGKLAYISEGNLWVRTLPDGAPRQLTTGGGDSRPRWSPSGEWLALRRGDGRVWVMRDTGENATALSGIGTAEMYAWSPVMDTLALTTHGTLSLASAPDWLAQPIATLPGEEGSIFPFAWSPDGAWLAFSDWYFLGPAQAQELRPRYASIQKVRPDGRERTELLSAGNPSEDWLELAGWSRDMREVYYWPDPMFSASLLADGSELRAVAVDGSQATRAIVPSMLLYRDFWSESPDGKTLAITEGGGRETWSDKRIARVDRSTGQLIYLTEAEAAFSPAWSPDGERLLYVAASDIGLVGGGPTAKAGIGERRIWIMNKDGSDQHALTGDSAYRDEFPQWSPDGQFILFARLNAADEASV